MGPVLIIPGLFVVVGEGLGEGEISQGDVGNGRKCPINRMGHEGQCLLEDGWI